MEDLRIKYRKIINNALSKLPTTIKAEDLRGHLNNLAPFPILNRQELTIWNEEVNLAIIDHCGDLPPIRSGQPIPCHGGALTHIPLQKPHVPLRPEWATQPPLL